MRTCARNHRLASSLTAGLLLLCTAAAPAAVTPIVEFKFNDTGTTTASTGSIAGVTGTIYNTTGVATDLRAPGVTGGTADRAFDNSAATGMGSAGTGGRVNVPVQSSLNGATAITVAGWFRVADADATGSAAYMIDIGSNDSAKTGLRITWDGVNRQLRTDISSNGVSMNQRTGVDSFAEKQAWVFFAFTYDSTLTSSQLKTYKGTTTAAGQTQMVKANSLGDARGRRLDARLRPPPLRPPGSGVQPEPDFPIPQPISKPRHYNAWAFC